MIPLLLALAWPSAAQIELVRERRASFPVNRLVAAVDWYQPQERVPGRRAKPLPVRPAARRTIGPHAIAAAEQLAAAQNSYALIIWRKGAIEAERYWPGFGSGSRYDTASMHKGVLAALLGIAVAEKRIGSVDDPLERYLPELKDSPRGALPLRALLEMASGIETPPVSDDPASPYWQSYFGDDLWQATARWPQTRPPFTEFYYANANSQYLGWAIERASGMRYARYLSTRLWAPMGAGDGYLWLDRKGGSPRTNCCLHATARDWLRFGMLLLNRGEAGGRRLVPASWIAQMTSPSRLNANYGWQVWRGSPHVAGRTYGRGIPAVIPTREPFARDDVVYLDGSGGQRVYVIPSAEMVIVRIGAASRTWDDSALPNLLLRGIDG